MASGEILGYLIGNGPRPIALARGDLLTIGREPQNSIFLEDALASRYHAVVETGANGEIQVRDLNSTNGTWVNGELLAKGAKSELHNGDIVRIGGKVLSFVGHDSTVEPRRLAVNAARRIADMETVAGSLVFANGKVEHSKESLEEAEVAELADLQDGDIMATRQGMRPVEPALSGNLSEQNLAQVLQFLSMISKSGELRVKGKVLEGCIAFNLGQPFWGLAGSHKGAQAVYACARERAGSFVFNSMDKPPDRPRNINEPVMQIIFECCKRIDETRLSGM